MIRKHLAKFLSMAAISLGMLGGQVVVGDIWTEVGDAPDGVPAAQVTVGISPLDNIIGLTDAGAGDFRDTYEIIITDPAAFYATTSPAFGNGTGTASFDTRLLLWDVNSGGVMANDDIAPGGAPFLSLISAPGLYPGVVDPGIPALVAGNRYFLSITGFNDNAFDAAGGDIFAMGADFDALHAPLSGPFASWMPGGATGEYTIELGGASFAVNIPEPATGVFALGVAGLFLARRRKIR